MRLLQLGTVMLGIAMATACSPAAIDELTGDDRALDDDGDGLLTSEENEIGTDPLVADSDEDGYSDGEEHEVGTDPLDGIDHPYTGGWAIDVDCRDDPSSIADSGYDIASNFTAPDQYGDTVKLYDFCDRTVLLVASAFW